MEIFRIRKTDGNGKFATKNEANVCFAQMQIWEVWNISFDWTLLGHQPDIKLILEK